MKQKYIIYFISLVFFSIISALVWTKTDSKPRSRNSNQGMQPEDASESNFYKKKEGNDDKRKRFGQLVKALATEKTKHGNKETLLQNRMAEVQEEIDKWAIPEEERKKKEMILRTIGPYIWEQGAATFDEIIKEQEPNNYWTEIERNKIDKALSNRECQGTQMQSLQCYKTMCKGEFHHVDEDAFNRFSDNVITEDVIDGPSQTFKIKGENGDIISKMYLGKTGKDDQLFGEMHTRLYEKVTGTSASLIDVSQYQSGSSSN